MDLKEVLGENYRDDMTLADVEAALSGLDLVDRSTATAGTVSKATFDKTASELAAAKKELKAKMTDDEKAAQARAEKDQQIQDELTELRRDRDVNRQLKELLALGYDEKLAQETAEAMVDGDFAKVYANQRTFLTEHDKAAKRAQTMANDKRPPAGDAQTGKDFTKMAADAAAHGDFAAQAYYTRLAQQNNE